MKLMIEHVPAHDRVQELYTFDELPSTTQDRLVRECGLRHYDDWDGEYGKTLHALEELFGVECVDWQVDTWTHGYSLYSRSSEYTHIRLEDATDEDGEEYGYLALSGIRAMGKCWTKWERKVVKGNYYSTGKWIDGKYHYKHRHSKVLFVGLHDGSCPLTGYCADNDALDPLWDMMEGKHVKDGTTIADMIDACFEAFFAAWQKDIEYRQSEDYFRECEMAEWYDADGNEVEVPEGAVLTDPEENEKEAS